MGTVLFYVGVAALALLQGADIWSTNRFLAAGVKEANPLMRFFMAHLGAAWWAPKAALTVVMCFGLYLFQIGFPMACGLLLALLVGAYVVIVWRNIKAGNR